MVSPSRENVVGQQPPRRVVAAKVTMKTAILLLTAYYLSSGGGIQGTMAFLLHPSPSSATTTTTTTTTTSSSMTKYSRTMVQMQIKNKKKKSSSSGGSGSVRAKKKGDRSKPQGFAGAIREIQMASFPYAGTVRPGKQSPQRTVIDRPDITLPDYANDGRPKNSPRLLPWVIDVKTSKEIDKMRAAGKVAREVLDLAGKAVEVGVTTDEIDALVHEETLKRGAYPSPLNYHGFPKSCCTSVNEIICHGIPDDRQLLEGDIINVDITCYLDGYHGDCSEMFIAGDGDDDAKRLLQVTYDSWISAMNYVKPGRDYKDIGGIIEDYVTSRGYTTVKNFCGHGIGSVFHTTPNILHYRNNEPNGQMAVGHTFTIEPMICEGLSKCLTWPDEWTASTLDGKRTAQFEHTLLITEDGVEPLTGKLDSSPVQFFEMESEVHKGIWLGTSGNKASSSPVEA